MNQGFWEKLKKPFFVIAPMADVTDAAFRRMFAKYGKPDVMWTEFVSADGLVLAPEEGKKKLLRDLMYTDAERPIVAQLFTASPERMRKAAEMVRELGFDGLDINMGCPADAIVRQGAGAEMIKNPALAREVIRAAKEGMGDLPVSVKTRIGYNKIELETWLREILAEEPAAVTIHARTRKEMSKVPAQWEWVKRAVEIRDEIGSKTFILGNGDVKDLADAKAKADATGADGVMLGRAIFGNPWVFKDKENFRRGISSSGHGYFFAKKFLVLASATLPMSFRANTSPSVSTREKLTAMLEHTRLFEELLGDIKSFAIMKKHYKAYVQGFEGAPELRAKLMETNTYSEVETLVHEFLKTTKF